MTNLSNSNIIEHVLQALIKKIGRRTSTGFAVVTIDTILKELRPKYDFLKYVLVQDTSYSEGIDAINVQYDINYVETDIFYTALDDIIKSAVRHLKRKADYFFIREFKEILDSIPGLEIEQKGINLDDMQLEYLVDRQEIFRINNSEVTENVIKTLICLLNKIYPEKQAIETMIASITKLEGKYNFLKYIKMSIEPDSKGFYTINAMPEINNALSPKVAEAIKKIIEEIGMSLKWEDEKETFVDAFKRELGEEQLANLEKMGINLSLIQMLMMKKEQGEIAKKTLKALVSVVGRSTSEGFAIVTIDNVIKNLMHTHNALKYIRIDQSRYSQGTDAINIMPEINNVEPYELAKALREVIKTTGTHLDENNVHSYIKEFKKELGDKYLQEIQKIGVNLHFLELKFA